MKTRIEGGMGGTEETETELEVGIKVEIRKIRAEGIDSERINRHRLHTRERGSSYPP